MIAVLTSLISPLNPSPFSISSNSIATFGRPEAVLFNPQNIGSAFSLELSVSSEFSNMLKRNYIGVQYRRFAFGWYSISAEDEDASFSEHLFALGYSFRGVGLNVLTYPEYITNPDGSLGMNWRFGAGFGIIRASYPFWISLSLVYLQDRQFGGVSLMYPSERLNMYLDAFMEKDYALSIRTGFLLKVHKSVNVIFGYDSGNSVFSAGLIVLTDRLRLGYAYRTHPYLGITNSGVISFTRR